MSGWLILKQADWIFSLEFQLESGLRNILHFNVDWNVSFSLSLCVRVWMCSYVTFKHKMTPCLAIRNEHKINDIAGNRLNSILIYIYNTSSFANEILEKLILSYTDAFQLCSIRDALCSISIYYLYVCIY